MLWPGLLTRSRITDQRPARLKTVRLLTAHKEQALRSSLRRVCVSWDPPLFLRTPDAATLLHKVGSLPCDSMEPAALASQRQEKGPSWHKPGRALVWRCFSWLAICPPCLQIGVIDGIRLSVAHVAGRHLFDLRCKLSVEGRRSPKRCSSAGNSTSAQGPLQGKTGCVLNFVGFEMKPEDKREISSIARDSGGKIGEIE